jgi:trans-aconitate 2-methyltransferase
MSWSPERYLAFGDHRTRPAVDLLARVALAAPARVADLGCGPGNSTALLCARWPQAEVVGLDSSPEMLAKARASGLSARWLEADLAGWVPAGAFDLLYSNAALQWLPDHARLLPRLLDALPPGGVLAVQMPRNFDAPSHVLLREVADRGPWAARLASRLLRAPVAAPEHYYDLLQPQAAALDIWESEYLQILEGDDPVLSWTRSTALRPVIAALDPDEQARFEADYAKRLRLAYPRRADGQTLFPFRRLFIVATRAR